MFDSWQQVTPVSLNRTELEWSMQSVESIIEQLIEEKRNLLAASAPAQPGSASIAGADAGTDTLSRDRAQQLDETPEVARESDDFDGRALPPPREVWADSSTSSSPTQQSYLHRSTEATQRRAQRLQQAPAIRSNRSRALFVARPLQPSPFCVRPVWHLDARSHPAPLTAGASNTRDGRAVWLQRPEAAPCMDPGSPPRSLCVRSCVFPCGELARRARAPAGPLEVVAGGR